MKPQFIHDCDKCEYLGSDSEYDYYTCLQSQSVSLRTYIARFGNEGYEYLSGPIDACAGGYEGFPKDYPICEAYRRYKGIKE